MLQVEPEREAIEALSHTDQVRMASLALAGWTFTRHAANVWIAQRQGWFDQYGQTLLHCLDGIEASSRSSGSGFKNLPDWAKVRPGAPRKN